MQQQIQYIKTNQLHESSLNPRKEFDQHGIDELAESIRQVGILQPIIARLNTTVIKKTIPIYEVICGSRRLSAAVIAGLTEVPVILRDLSDEEAFDLMITENLQRKDVSPLEEAVAYQSLISKGTYDVHSLSIRFGKSESYIRQRVKLNDLINEFKDLLRKEVINLSAALEIAKLNQDNQIELYDDSYKNHEQAYGSLPSLKQLKRTIERDFMTDLSDAPFDIHDVTLGPFGSCIGCQFNTASETLLFPDAPEQGRCINITCFKEKKNRHFEREIQRVQQEEPDVILGAPGYIYGEEEKRINEMKKQGVPVVEMSWSNGFSEVTIPEQPDTPDASYYETTEDYEEAMEDYLDEVKDYENDLKEYNEKIASGVVRKVFMAAGNDKGKVRYYEPVGKRANGSLSEQSGADVAKEEQIKELQEKDKRNAELAFEKTYTDVKGLLEENIYSNIEENLSQSEWQAVYVVLLESIGHVPLREEINPEGSYIDNKQKTEIASKLDINQINRLFRAFLQNRLETGSPLYQVSEAKSLISIASEKYPELVKEIDLKHQGVYLKRKESIEKKIQELTSNQ
ncbi:MAG: ParB/RepB/Spo0J family partition protein [Bacteroidales bacterium]|nr:ParB/RepB/Spo0J family partition protein [Bacteroidales bacterium]